MAFSEPNFALLVYVNKTGYQRRCLPSDFPLWNSSVYGYFEKLPNNKIFEIINNILFHLRERQGRSKHPSLICIDSQSVKGDI